MTQSIRSFSLTVLVCLLTSIHMSAQTYEAAVKTIGLRKCYAVIDSVSGYHNQDSVFIAHGPFREFNKGKLRVEGSYSHGLRSGVWKKYYDDGKLCTKGMYADDKEHGAWKYYYDTDTLASTFFFNRGNKAGTWTGYGFNGRKQITRTYDTEGKLILEKLWYTTGDRGIAWQDSIIYNNADTSIFKTLYYKNGKVFVRYGATNRKLFGTFEKFYSTGVLWESLEYKNGEIAKVNGMNDRFGKPLDYGSFNYGLGILKRFHMNGSLWMENSYKGDITNFDQKFYGHSGVLESQGTIENGEPKGLWVRYSGGRKDYEIDIQDSGKTVVIQYLNNLKHAEERYLHGYPHGKWVSYNGYGEVELTRYFEKGYLHGPYDGYDHSSSISGKGEYYHGSPVGKWTFTTISNRKFLYDIDFETDPFLDTTGMERENLIPILYNYCQSEYDYQGVIREQRFYDGDKGCIYWSMADIDRLDQVRGGYIPDAVIQVDFKIGYFGETFDVITRRSYTKDRDLQMEVHENVYNMPFLRPRLVLGIPEVANSTYGKYKDVHRKKD